MRRRSSAHRRDDNHQAPSKYRAKRTVVDGVTFASQKEARRYQELRLLERAGEICQLELQPVFELVVVEMTVGSRLKRAAAKMAGRSTHGIGHVAVGSYRGDFRYRTGDDGTGAVVVEDVKGFKTPLYRWKKKHVEAQYGIQIREV